MPVIYKIFPSIDDDTLSFIETEYVKSELSISVPLRAIEILPSSSKFTLDKSAKTGGSFTGITSTVKLSVTVELPSLAKTFTIDEPFALP